jgi:hypothetical protein
MTKLKARSAKSRRPRPHIHVGSYWSPFGPEEGQSVAKRYFHACADVLDALDALERSGYFAPFEIVIFPQLTSKKSSGAV